MTRRSAVHDYSRPGIYHITMRVAEGMGSPLGKVIGDVQAPDGSPDAPRVALSPVGQMVECELLTAIHSHYPMVAVQDYIVMPEHLHFLLVVKSNLVSAQGKRVPLGQVIAGFKKGCNRRYWEMTGNGGRETAAHSAESASVADGLPISPRSPGSYKVPSDGTSGRPTLFAPGFCDVMPVDEAQLATQRAYIRANPRSRLLRTGHRDWLMPRRGGIATALTVAALLGYLRRECAPSQATPDALAALAARLITKPAPDTSQPTTPGGSPLILCDSYGDTTLLTGRRCLPVVCHRRDKSRFDEQMARCLDEAAAGAVLVSSRIAKGEQAIIDEAIRRGYPVVLVADNGFPDRYHPSAAQLDLCAAGRLLLVTPWRYRYRGRQEAITVPECKAMNCLAQALCHKKDSWWKDLAPAGVPGGIQSVP